MIFLEHITLQFDGCVTPALHDINLRVAAGEAVCIMGRNGSGKTSLLRIIAGLMQATRGQVKINGDPPGQSTARKVGILFQNTDNQMVATLVEKELAFGLENQSVPQQCMETLIDDACARFRIAAFRRRLTSGLSGGEKQRVALASIMILDPPVLLLDEPDTFLDAESQALVREELRRLHREFPNLTELRITQNPSIARDYDRLIIIDKGEVIADDQTSRLLSDGILLGRAGLVCRPRPVVSSIALNGSAPSHGRLHAVEARHVTFGYSPGVAVLEDISFSIRAGEIAALIGATGTGKSSLGLLLCGIHKPAAGSVHYLASDDSVLSYQTLKGQIVALLQRAERQFFLDSCAREIAFGPENLGNKLSAAEIDACLDLVGLSPERFRSRDPFSLSEGEKRRLAFATVLSMNPSVLIFDEPTAGLDPDGVGWFVGLARLLKAKGKGQLVISHDRYLVHQLADRLHILRSPGQIDQVDPADVDNLADIQRVLAPSHDILGQ